MSKFMSRLIPSFLISTIFLVACSSTPVEPVQSQSTTLEATTPPPVARSAMPSATASVVPVTVEPYLDPSSAIYKNRSVYFDFDQFQIKPDDLTVLEQNAKYLAGHPTVSIKIEGNTDEQGGSEYNLALGQKRAEAVLRFLKTYGVHDTQLEAISFGKEKPRALGHDEISHAQNRRADLTYPAK